MTDPITHLIHHPYQPPAGFEAPQPGVFKASTVFFPTVAAMRSREWKDKSAYTYGLHGTPTSYALEERLATLEGGKECLLVPSGLAALGLVALSLLRSGDEVLLPDNAYGPNKSIVEGELMGWGITHQYYNPMDPEDLEAQISSRTKLVWLEAAGSVSLEFPNIVEMVRICQRRKVLTALDNTWGAGLAFNPFDLVPGTSIPVAVDISAHALTKYPSGGGDVLMGSVITRNAGLHLKLKLTHMRFGIGVGMNDVEAVLRSLPTIGLRYRAHDAATRSLAAWAQTQPEFVQVLHPSLPESPGHSHWMALTGGEEGKAAGLFSVML
ncbi:MAG: cystathionine beta-lyase, partial [Betaproteobacteria bacterium]|nr:cystathionine beta-lyase [Betaproteobacteria bacterium]